MQTVIVGLPNGQNKNGDINDAGNYKPASLAIIVSMLFEHCILSCITPFLAKTDKFGFKSRHSSDICIIFTVRLYPLGVGRVLGKTGICPHWILGLRTKNL